MQNLNTIAIIVAGGKGKRMGRPKQFLKINGKPMLWWAVSAFQKARMIDGIILVVAREQIRLAKRLRFSKIIKVVSGGKERQDSVRKGLKVLPGSAMVVAIHDGALAGGHAGNNRTVGRGRSKIWGGGGRGTGEGHDQESKQ